MGGSLRVLFIEDSNDDATLQVRFLEQGGYRVDFLRVDTPQELTKALKDTWDLIISDYSMPYFTGLDALEIVKEHSCEVPFLFVSGTIGEDVAVKALKSGAQDYLMKGSLHRLVASVERELRDAEERRTRRQLEQEVRCLQRFEALGRLAGGVAHDFNNVVGAIMGWSEIGLEEGKENPRTRERFLRIRTQAEKAAVLTKQLLAYARRQILQPCNTDLNETVREELSLLQNVIGERIGVVLRLSPDSCIAWADPCQVEEILMNLCLNARDAMPEGGTIIIETSNVAIGTDHSVIRPWMIPGNYAVLRVCDTGMGMNEEIRERIFEPFFTTKELGKEAGLGLATLYGIVKQHKGFIEVDSGVGKGSTFQVYLPAGTGKPLSAARIETDFGVTGREEILFAEDNDALRAATKEYLESLGYKVYAANDGVEAIRRFKERASSIDMLLFDVVMPKLDGLGALVQIRKMRSEIPVMFTSGHAAEAALVENDFGKSTAILQKPYGMHNLAVRLREILNKNKAGS